MCWVDIIKNTYHQNLHGFVVNKSSRSRAKQYLVEESKWDICFFLLHLNIHHVLLLIFIFILIAGLSIQLKQPMFLYKFNSNLWYYSLAVLSIFVHEYIKLCSPNIIMCMLLLNQIFTGNVFRSHGVFQAYKGC